MRAMEHTSTPTQALLDARTILDRGKKLEGLRVAIIGESSTGGGLVERVSSFEYGADHRIYAAASLLPQESGKSPRGHADDT